MTSFAIDTLSMIIDRLSMVITCTTHVEYSLGLNSQCKVRSTVLWPAAYCQIPIAKTKRSIPHMTHYTSTIMALRHCPTIIDMIAAFSSSRTIKTPNSS